ncbi:hypothetical protein J6590_047290 [Homalodisca vitripennis]|nr:hypothetical protein J6590_047290 [Homalodisca vitripennis]
MLHAVSVVVTRNSRRTFSSTDWLNRKRYHYVTAHEETLETFRPLHVDCRSLEKANSLEHGWQQAPKIISG